MINIKEFIKQKYPLVTDADLTGEGRTTMYLPDVVQLMEDLQRLLQQTPCYVGEAELLVCDNCTDVESYYLGTVCPKCSKPFRSVKQTNGT